MLDIESILNQYVHPKRLSRTAQGFKMLCPYHDDNNPSFHISLEKGHCKCFACKEYRTIFSFLVEHNVPFDIAIEYFFEEYAGSGRIMQEGRDYILGTRLPKSMIDRGILPETLKHFKVGYDTFEKRITIPMLYNDKVYGVKYRVYPKNFWYSDGFVKEQFLYNYEPTEERTYVEGEVDTWMVWQNGDTQVTGVLGSEITESQEKMLLKHRVINLALDNDMAGYRCAFQIHDRVKKDADVYVIPYTKKDPALVKSSTEWLEAKQNRWSFLEFELSFSQRYKKEYREILEKLKNR